MKKIKISFILSGRVSVTSCLPYTTYATSIAYKVLYQENSGADTVSISIENLLKNGLW